MSGLVEHLARSGLVLVQGYGHRYVPTSVGRVHVLEKEQHGGLPPLVLLHGLSSAGVHYYRVLKHLAQMSRVVLPDLPGHGFSDVPGRFDEEAMIAGLFEALDAVIDRPAVLCGTSLGGYLALRYALARPQKVLGLVLASPGGASMGAEELRLLRARFRLGSHREALDFADALFARRSRIRHLYAVGLRRYFQLPQTLAVLEGMTLSQLFLPGQLKVLSMPVLLLWGGHERILPLSHLQFFVENLPAHARVERPAGWGHSPFLDDPEGFARRLVTFAAAL
ncbi:MAG: putative hydrolase [Myxococcaceae bacterium]|nr:putative hydrolase [Myxococcaceae bacterium]